MRRIPNDLFDSAAVLTRIVPIADDADEGYAVLSEAAERHGEDLDRVRTAVMLLGRRGIVQYQTTYQTGDKPLDVTIERWVYDEVADRSA